MDVAIKDESLDWSAKTTTSTDTIVAPVAKGIDVITIDDDFESYEPQSKENKLITLAYNKEPKEQKLISWRTKRTETLNNFFSYFQFYLIASYQNCLLQMINNYYITTVL
uniref:Uncharacterized protein n=1 Tax=Heterorhabditis bacteriophora TaxID=37862 RepID=A0A1I7WTB2_HETBA